MGITLDADLSKESMPHIPKKPSAKMTHFHLNDKSEPHYRNGEIINFDLEVQANKSIDDLRFRCEIRYMDDTPVGISLSPSLGSLSAGDLHIFNMSLACTDLLTGGKYKCLFVLYSVNEFGTFADYDAIYPVFAFEIEDIPDLAWNGTMWGRIKFSDISVN